MSDSVNAQPVIEADQDHWCRTVAGNTTKTTFLWTIENFNKLKEEKNERLFSANFSVRGPGHMITEWYLQLYPKGQDPDPEEEDDDDDDEDDYVDLYIHNNDDFDVKAAASFSIVDSSEKELETISPEQNTFVDDLGWGGHFVKLDNLRNNSSTLLPDGNLKILCKLEVFGQDKIFSGSKGTLNKTQISDECQKQVINHLDNLFTGKDASDLEITCDGEVFNCHQIILSARSPVFHAMFQADMIENHSKKVNVSDVRKAVFSEVLRFIYTGKVSSDDSLKEQARDILVAANKYQLDLLKKLCEAQLISTLNASNCFDLLVLGDLHEAAKLKMAALDFVSMNSASLIETDVYKDFLYQQHLDLVFEVTKAMIPKRENNN